MSDFSFTHERKDTGISVIRDDEIKDFDPVFDLYGDKPATGYYKDKLKILELRYRDLYRETLENSEKLKKWAKSNGFEQFDFREDLNNFYVQFERENIKISYHISPDVDPDDFASILFQVWDTTKEKMMHPSTGWLGKMGATPILTMKKFPTSLKLINEVCDNHLELLYLKESLKTT